MYHVFADETKQDYIDVEDRYISVICSVFGHRDITTDIEEKISSIVTKYGSKELKFTGISSKNHIFMLDECFSLVLPYIKAKQLNIYAVCRDSNDQRYHNIKYDENKDFDIMMYHCTKGICNRVTRGNPIVLYPDERAQSQWQDIQYYINQTKRLNKEKREILTNGLFDITNEFPLYETFHISNIIPIKSHENGLVQIADIIGGLIGFSCIAGEKYHERLHNKSIKDSLFPEHNLQVDFSKRQEYKFEVLESLDKYCKQYKLGVSLKKHKKLVTNQDKGFYIHHYESQGTYDKAPKR